MTTLDERQLSVLVAIYFWQPTPGEMRAAIHGSIDGVLTTLRSLGLCVPRVGGPRPYRWYTTVKGDTIVTAWDAAGRPDTWEL